MPTRPASVNNDIEFHLKMLSNIDFVYSPESFEHELRVKIDLEEIARRIFGQSLNGSVDTVKIRVGNELHSFRVRTNSDRNKNHIVEHVGSRTIS